MGQNGKKTDGTSAFKIELEDAPAPKPSAAPASALTTPSPARTSVPPRPTLLRSRPVEATPDPAGFITRAVAMLIDGCLILLVAAFLRKLTSPVFLSLFHVAYFAGWQCSSYRATPGKLLLGIRVRRSDGRRLSSSAAVIRAFASLVSSWFLYLGYLMALLSPDRLTLHDRIAGSRVEITRPVRPAWAGLVAIVALVVAFKVVPRLGGMRIEGRTFSTSGLRTVDEFAADPCAGKQYCVMTYVTPWCPACHSAKPMIGQLRDYLNTRTQVGYRVIVGQDTDRKIQAEAKTFGEPTLMDLDGAFAARMGIHSYPTWIVVRMSDNRVVNQPDSIVTSRLLSPAELSEFAPRFLGLDPELLR